MVRVVKICQDRMKRAASLPDCPRGLVTRRYSPISGDWPAPRDSEVDLRDSALLYPPQIQGLDCAGDTRQRFGVAVSPQYLLRMTK